MSGAAASTTRYVDPIQMLVSAAGKAGRFEINSVTVSDAGALDVEQPAPPSYCRFTVEGHTLSVRLSPFSIGFDCLVTGSLGHIPFTAENRTARSDVLEIIRATQGLDRARFHVGHGQEVFLIAERRSDEPAVPEALVHELVLVIQETRPFLRLLADYLI